MSLIDYWKGPAHRHRAEELDLQLTELQSRHNQLQVFSSKIGAMEAFEVQAFIFAIGRLKVVVAGGFRPIAGVRKRQLTAKKQTVNLLLMTS